MLSLADVLPNAPSTTADALELFDSCPAVESESIRGTWHGAELPTGHPLDGMLAASGWWGKAFLDSETVHPLLFRGGSGDVLWALNPVLAFGGLGLVTRIPALSRRNIAGAINLLTPVLRTRLPRARLRTTRYRGVDTATMIYDQLPINDVFRRLDDQTLLGAMDLRGVRAPYFFVLRQENSMTLM